MPNHLYIPIAGTWARARQDHESAWYRRGSPFDKVMNKRGYERVEQDRVPSRPDDGYWSGAVNGLLIQWFAWWRDKHPAWRTGGETLRGFLRARRGELLDAGGVTIVAHSHGGQALAYALVDMHTAICPLYVVTVDMPVRRHMDDFYRRASAKCSCWMHRYSERGWKSRFRWLGNRFGPRTLEVANCNREVTGGHSGMLRNPRHIGQWDEIRRRTCSNSFGPCPVLQSEKETATHGLTGGRRPTRHDPASCEEAFHRPGCRSWRR